MSLGLLGVITEVTLQCEESFKLEEKTEKLTLSSCLDQLDHIAASAEYAAVWSEFYSQRCSIHRYSRTTSAVRMSDQLWKIGMKVGVVIYIACLFVCACAHVCTCTEDSRQSVNY